MKKIFTFLVAFLTTVSGAVWAETNPSGTSETSPYDLATRGGLEITDDGEYWVTCSSVTGNGITISGSNADPTVYLQGINIDVAGKAIIIENMANPTFVLFGENKITSDGAASVISDDAAIHIARASTLTISELSTGILDINMNANSSQNMVAIGNAGNSLDPFHDCGSVTVKGGTIKTNGYFGEFDIHGFRFQENAIVIAQDIEGYDRNTSDLRNGGLIYLDGNTTGEFHNAAEDKDFTLNSPLPEPYKIELRQDGVKVEIGPEQTLNEDQLSGEGLAKGYKVVYSSPTDVPMNVSGELPANKFVGSKYTVEQWNPTATVKEENTTYEHIGTHWLKDGTNWVPVNTEVIEKQATQYTTLSEMKTKEYQAVWYLKTKTISYNLADGFSGSFNLWYPNVDFLFTSEEQEGENLKSLKDVGLKLSEENGYVINPDSPINVDEGTFTTKLNLSPIATQDAPNKKETTLIVETSSEELSINNSEKVSITLNKKEFVYNGEEQQDVATLVSVTNKTTGTPFTYNKHYVLQFSQEGKSVSFRDKGSYTVTVVAKEGNGLLTDQKELAETVEIKPATLKVSEVSNVEWNIKDGGTPAYKDAKFTLETIYSVGETKDDVSINATAESFNASVTGATWQTTPGTYTVNYSGLALTGSRAFNYTLEPATAEGKLVVSVEGSKDDPIDDDGEDPLITGAGDWAEETTYDGVEHPLEKIMVTYGEEEKEITIPSESIEYSYLPIDAEEGATPTSTDEVKNAGTYTATFTFPKNDYGYKGIGKVSLTIGKATLTIKAATGEYIQVTEGDTWDDIRISNEGTQYISFEKSPANEEAVLYTATLDPQQEGTIEKSEDAIENAYKVTNLELTNGENFNPDNYTYTLGDVYVGAIVGKITINPGGDGEGGEEGDGVTGGEDENNDDELDFILSHPDGEGQCSVYDGEPHGLDVLYVGEKYRLDKGTDYTVSYEGFGADEEPVNAGEYRATITLSEDSKYQLEGDEQSFDLTIHIAERPVTVGFDLPASIDASTKTLDASDYADWQKEGVVPNEGLVNDEKPICEGTLFLVESEDYPGYFNVYLDKKTFKVEDNPSFSFLVSNYIISVETKDGKIELEENGEGGETLPDDPNNPDDPIIDGPDEDDPTGGIEIDDSGSTGGSGISTKRYRLYLANQDYLNTGDYKKYYDELGLVLHSRHNQKYTTNTDKSFTIWYTQDGEVNAGGFRVFMSNHANGEYKEVKLDEVSGYYQIRNVTSNVYVKLCWSNGHPVANEDITATDARAYAQPNKIVVITPQPTDVQIISMAGAVVATDKVTGQREFANLTEGVYIVRMGETVVKLQVRK